MLIELKKTLKNTVTIKKNVYSTIDSLKFIVIILIIITITDDNNY